MLRSRAMKAAVYYETGPPDVFRYEDVADPACPPDGVVVDVAAISIEGGDTLNRLRGEMPAVPHIVGYQCAGISPRRRLRVSPPSMLMAATSTTTPSGGHAGSATSS